MPDMMTSGEVSRPRRCPTELKRTDGQQEKQTMMGGFLLSWSPLLTHNTSPCVNLRQARGARLCFSGHRAMECRSVDVVLVNWAICESDREKNSHCRSGGRRLRCFLRCSLLFVVVFKIKKMIKIQPSLFCPSIYSQSPLCYTVCV